MNTGVELPACHAEGWNSRENLYHSWARRHCHVEPLSVLDCANAVRPLDRRAHGKDILHSRVPILAEGAKCKQSRVDADLPAWSDACRGISGDGKP